MRSLWRTRVGSLVRKNRTVRTATGYITKLKENIFVQPPERGKSGEGPGKVRAKSGECLFQEGQKKEVTAHNIFSVLPAGLCGAHSHSLPSYSGAWRICTLPCHASLTGTAAARHHLRPLVQAARQRNKQLNQPTNLAAQKPGRSQTSCDVFVVCLTVSHSVPVSVSGSQSPRQSVFFCNNCEAFAHPVSSVKSRCCELPIPRDASSPSQTRATRPHRQRHADPSSTVAHQNVFSQVASLHSVASANRWAHCALQHTLSMCTLGTFCSQAEVMVERHFPSKHPQYVGGLASQKACGVQEWRPRWVACTLSCKH